MKVSPLLLFLPFSLAAAPAPDPADAVLLRMEKAESDVSSLRFSFTQKTLVKITAEEQSLRGTAVFRRPASFRVQHLAPRSQTVVSDGKTLWFYSPDRRQVLVDAWENWSRSAGFPKGLSPFQDKASSFRDRYDVSYLRRDGEDDVLSLVPKDPGAWPYSLRLRIDPRGIPVRTELESQSIHTVTAIDAVEVNPLLKDDVFTFAPPAGVEVFGLPAKDKEGSSR